MLETVSYRIGDRQLLDGLSLRVAAGRSVSVMGPSGSGKSTLLSVVLGLIRPQSGRILVAGQDVARMGKRRAAVHRSTSTGMVFQFGELLPELSPLDNAALPALMAHRPANEAYQAAKELLQQLGVPLADTQTATLSGGERQRVAVARAMINSPGLLLADEPTGSLDRATRDVVADALFALPAQRCCGLLVVTHDHDIAGRADEVFELVDGRARRCEVPA